LIIIEKSCTCKFINSVKLKEETLDLLNVQKSKKFIKALG
jgi:phage FluMu protein Com